MTTEVTVERMTFGKCKNCLIQEAVYSGGICEECHQNKARVVRALYERGLEPGTKEFIEQLQLNGVYY